jgi:hypothetical protein
MPDLIRLYIRHVFIGFLLGAAFTALLLWLNVANLRHLVTATREGPLAVVMLVVFNAIVFSGVQFAYAVMTMPFGSAPPLQAGGPPAVTDLK